MSFTRTLLTLLLLTAIPFAASAQNKKLSKKQLLKERIELQKTIDSLKSIIEGGTVEMSDTTQYGADSEENGFNYVDSEIGRAHV